MFNTTPLQNVRNPWLFCGWMSPSSPSQVLLTLDRCGMASGGKVTCAVVSNIQMSTSLNMNLELSTKLNKLDPRSGLLDYHAAWFELFLSNARLKR